MGGRSRQIAGGLLTGLGEGILLKAENIEARQAEARKAAAQYGGRHAGDSRLLADIVTAHTTENSLGETIINRDKIFESLMARGRDDLAYDYRPDPNQTPDRDSDEYVGYRAEGKSAYKKLDPVGPNFLYGDDWSNTVKKDVYDGLDEGPWIDRYADERWADKHGGAGKKSGGLAGSAVTATVADPTQAAKPKTGLAPTAAAPAAPTAPKPATLSGSGTRDDPYKPSAGQSDSDWFAANAKPGEVIEIAGQLWESDPESKTGLKKAGSNAGTGKGTKASPHRPKTKADFDKIKAGDHFVDPGDGQTYTK